MRHLRRGAAALTAALLLSLSPAAAIAAQADDRPLTFTDPTTVQIEYGQYWSLRILAADDPGPFYADDILLSGTGVPEGYVPAFYGSIGAGMSTVATVGPSDSLRPLNAGTYQLTLAISDPDLDPATWTTTNQATLTVTAAAIGADLRVVADPANGDNAIVSALFTGRFIDEYYTSAFANAPLSPAGVWKITVRDTAGDVAVERSIERAEGDDVLATSFYFTDAKPGESYTASATFTPSGASASNFDVTQPQDFAYTAPESVRPVPSSSASAPEAPPLAEPVGFALPLWAVIVVGILIAGLTALVIVFAVRTARRRPVAEVAA